MNKKMISVFVMIFGSLGAYVPVWAGVDDGFGGWSILGGLVGGIFGIWLGVWISKRF